MLVGDLVMATREAITDLPGTLIPPSNLVLTPVAGSIPAGTYYVVMTLINNWGETVPSNEASITLSSPGGIQVAVTLNSSSFGLTGCKVYIGNAAGQEFMSSTGAVPIAPFSITSIANLPNGNPPTRNTAYIPDLDGDAVSAGSMFRWLNDALKLASQVCGGLLDYSGVGSVNGTPQYIVPGQWKKLASVWYDGYPLAMDDNGNYFRRNSITASVLSSVALSTFNNQMMIEVWPQPSSTASQTTLAAQMLIGQTSAQLTSSAGFLLPMASCKSARRS